MPHPLFHYTQWKMYFHPIVIKSDIFQSDRNLPSALSPLVLYSKLWLGAKVIDSSYNWMGQVAVFHQYLEISL